VSRLARTNNLNPWPDGLTPQLPVKRAILQRLGDLRRMVDNKLRYGNTHITVAVVFGAGIGAGSVGE
jgi:hypothetical protein